jgi:hypothetical protein
VQVPSHTEHSQHDADPGFQEFNRLADAFQPEDPERLADQPTTTGSADVSEFRLYILMQRSASSFVISNPVRGRWLGTGTCTLGGPDRRLCACQWAVEFMWW